MTELTPEERKAYRILLGCNALIKSRGYYTNFKGVRLDQKSFEFLTHKEYLHRKNTAVNQKDWYNIDEDTGCEEIKGDPKND